MQSTNQTDPSVSAGHFEINRMSKAKGVMEHINVNYALSGLPFTRFIDLELSTADAAIFSVEIADVNGKKFPLSGWKAASASHRHITQLNISQLQAGNYKLNIYWSESKEVLHSIPFEKKNG